MITNLDAVPATPCALPDLTELSPKKKNKKYILQYGRGYLTQYAQSGSVDFYKGRDRYAMLDRYANGDNRVESVLVQETNARDQVTAPIDFRPLPLLHKPLMSVEGLLKEHSYEVTITPVDPVSQNERQEYESKMRAWMDHQAFLQSIGLQQPGGAGADIPVDEDDLAMHMDVSYKIREAIDLEQKTAYAMYLADFARQDQQCTRDETVRGVSVLFMRRSGPRRLPVRLAVEDCFIMPARSEDFPNLQAGAHLERLSLGQVLAEIANDPDTTLESEDLDRLKNIARERQFSGNPYGGQYYLDSDLGSSPEMAGEIVVVRFAFVSTDLEVQKEYVNKFGNKQIRQMEANYGGPQEANPGQAKDMKIHRKPVQNWYQGTLILGTEIGYGCGRAYEQLRDEDNPFACLPLYIVNAPGMVGNRIKSLVERSIPMVDAASRAFVKMNNTMAKWPDIYAKFNRNALQEAVTDKGVAAANNSGVASAMKFFIEHGVVVGDEYDEQGNPLGEAVNIRTLPIMEAVAGHLQTIAAMEAKLADLTGINGAVSGDDPMSRQGEGVTQLSIQGSQNALNHFFVAKRSRFERACKAIAASVKAGEDKGRAPLTGTMDVMGKNGRKAQVYLKPNPGIASRGYAFKIEQKPTQEQWASFYAAANNALLQKEITLADMAFLYTVDNLKQARYLLAARAKRNEAKVAQQAEANSKMQGEQAAAAAQAKGEEDRSTRTHDADETIRVANVTKRWDMDIARIQAGQHLEQAQINQQGALQKQENDHAHAAVMADAADSHDLMKHDATLNSQEQMAQQQQAHEQEMLARQPEPATA